MLREEQPSVPVDAANKVQRGNEKIALLRQVVDAGSGEGALWAGMRIHLISSTAVDKLGASSKFNAEWDFLTMLRDEGRRTAEAFLAAHGPDVGKRSTLDLDRLLVEV